MYWFHCFRDHWKSLILVHIRFPDYLCGTWFYIFVQFFRMFGECDVPLRFQRSKRSSSAQISHSMVLDLTISMLLGAIRLLRSRILTKNFKLVSISNCGYFVLPSYIYFRISLTDTFVYLLLHRVHSWFNRDRPRHYSGTLWWCICFRSASIPPRTNHSFLAHPPGRWFVLLTAVNTTHGQTVSIPDLIYWQILLMGESRLNGGEIAILGTKFVLIVHIFWWVMHRKVLPHHEFKVNWFYYAP